MDEAQEATGPVRDKGRSNNRKRLFSPTAETLTEAPPPKRVNRGCDENDSTDDHEIASLKAILGLNENPDEALRKYLQNLRNEEDVQTFYNTFKKELKLAPAPESTPPAEDKAKYPVVDPKALAEVRAKVAKEAKTGKKGSSEKLTEFFFFLLLSTEVQAIVLKMHLVQDSEVICPFYCHGYRPDDPVFTLKELDVMSRYPVPAIWHRERPNVNLALLGVNKDLRTLGSPYFWCSHYFLFNDARSCLWFFEKIGTANMRQVHHAIFNLSSGFFLSTEYRKKSDICEEQRWCKVFELLKSNHQLWKCIIRFYSWNDLLPRKNLSDDDKVKMTKGRFDLVAILAGFRGVARVIVENDKCDFLGQHERTQLARLMTATEKQKPLGSHSMEISMVEKL
ncbi:hypothetical protein EPUS_03744 [Endocarpon pusillum Z07020]|uniref:Uncharacterized protein n=1 Tax=Endocarpon pusillum (strain Z07020 / HMAS-L-300199) TaxID=1263415 RepID=U1G9Q7_ENDPU|nr:uncharacterized protein EPUS_03744 [Endocarpon pusillum Z07020]ERF68426.1 hypothetical protein EPUS_03744 [Endocarpon pusillum Z07020]